MIYPTVIETQRNGHQLGEPVELARYTVAAGERVLYGQRVDGVVRVICPPFVCLAPVRDALATADPDVAVGAQDIHHELAGAYTGDISAPMLDGLATWVIVGHSERRRDHGETDQRVALKLGRAADAGLRPILCVGEQLADRDAGRAMEVVDRQLTECLGGHEPDAMVSKFQSTEEIHVVVAGGTAGRFSVAIPGWLGTKNGSRPVTRLVE